MFESVTIYFAAASGAVTTVVIIATASLPPVSTGGLIEIIAGGSRYWLFVVIDSCRDGGIVIYRLSVAGRTDLHP